MGRMLQDKREQIEHNVGSCRKLCYTCAVWRPGRSLERETPRKLFVTAEAHP